MEKPNDEPLVCCICGKPIESENGWTQGHNAEPVANGRCCRECNFAFVIPARLGALTGRQVATEVEESPEHWLYLLMHNGYVRVVGENDNWSVAHQMTGETGRLFAAAPQLLEALKQCRVWLSEFVQPEGVDKLFRDYDALIRNVEEERW